VPLHESPERIGVATSGPAYRSRIGHLHMTERLD
jgi:hypothetical protein